MGNLLKLGTVCFIFVKPPTRLHEVYRNIFAGGVMKGGQDVYSGWIVIQHVPPSYAGLLLEP